jgi:hypothetical protein
MSGTVFVVQGEVGIEGLWTAITAARSFDKRLLSLPSEATHWVHYTSGGTAALEGKWIFGATHTAATAFVIAQVVENGTLGGGDAEGCLLLSSVSGAWGAENVKLAGGSNDATIAEAPIALQVQGLTVKAVWLTAEGYAVTLTFSGALPTASAGTNIGIQLPSAASLELTGQNKIHRMQAINTANASGAILKYALLY